MITKYHKRENRPRRSWTNSLPGVVPGWEFQLKSRIRGEVRIHESLEDYSMRHGGGNADALVFPADQEDLYQVLAFAEKYQVPWSVLGSGSHVWIRDPGIHGIVLNLCRSFNRFEILKEDDEQILLWVEAGVAISQVVHRGRDLKIQGIEPWAGISGTVGGAVWTNAGNGTGEIRDALETIEVMLTDGTRKTYSRSELKYHDRQIQLPERGIILSGKFRFRKNRNKNDAPKTDRKISSPSWWLTLAPLWSLLHLESLPSTRRHDR